MCFFVSFFSFWVCVGSVRLQQEKGALSCGGFLLCCGNHGERKGVEREMEREIEREKDKEREREREREKEKDATQNLFQACANGNLKIVRSLIEIEGA